MCARLSTFPLSSHPLSSLHSPFPYTYELVVDLLQRGFKSFPLSTAVLQELWECEQWPSIQEQLRYHTATGKQWYQHGGAVRRNKYGRRREREQLEQDKGYIHRRKEGEGMELHTAMSKKKKKEKRWKLLVCVIHTLVISQFHVEHTPRYVLRTHITLIILNANKCNCQTKQGTGCTWSQNIWAEGDVGGGGGPVYHTSCIWTLASSATSSAAIYYVTHASMSLVQHQRESPGVSSTVYAQVLTGRSFWTWRISCEF